MTADGGPSAQQENYFYQNALREYVFPSHIFYVSG